LKRIINIFVLNCEALNGYIGKYPLWGRVSANIIWFDLGEKYEEGIRNKGKM
jgi:hypothetical protein